jgi:hypothetical protein
MGRRVHLNNRILWRISWKMLNQIDQQKWWGKWCVAIIRHVIERYGEWIVCNKDKEWDHGAPHEGIYWRLVKKILNQNQWARTTRNNFRCYATSATKSLYKRCTFNQVNGPEKHYMISFSFYGSWEPRLGPLWRTNTNLYFQNIYLLCLKTCIFFRLSEKYFGILNYCHPKEFN